MQTKSLRAAGVSPGGLDRRVTLEAALCLTAGILAASALVQAASLFPGVPNLSGMPLSSIANAQTAQMVAAGNGYSILSTNTSGEANVLVQDARAEELTVYRTDSQGLLTPVQRIRLQSVFVEGRARFGQQ